jgi:hypothetical protein
MNGHMCDIRLVLHIPMPSPNAARNAQLPLVRARMIQIRVEIEQPATPPDANRARCSSHLLAISSMCLHVRCLAS